MKRFGIGVVALATALEIAAAGGALGASAPVVKAVHNKTYGNIVADAKGISLYLLSSESKGNVTCTTLCAVFWPPLTVPSGTKTVSAAPGVKGKLGIVKRPDGSLQITYNGYPVYYYLSDSSQGDTKGEDISSFGGTWYLLSASAMTPKTTPIR